MLPSDPLPFSVTDFPALTGQDHQKAIQKAIGEAVWQQQQLSTSSEDPTFENTIVELERIRSRVVAATDVFSLVVFDSRPDVLAAEEAIAEPLSRFYNALFQDTGIWERVQHLLLQDNSELEPDAHWLLEQYHLEFVRSGANLTSAQKQEVQDLYSELAQDGVRFSKNVLAATQVPFVVTDEALLSGLSSELCDSALSLAKEKGLTGWAFSLSMPNARALLQESTDPDFRESVWQAFYNRGASGEFDNHALMKKILISRSKIATIMDYPNWAAFTLNSMMAKTPEKAIALMEQVWDCVRGGFQKQAIRLGEEATLDGLPSLRPSDWFHYSETVRQKDYTFDGAAMRTYFPLSQVRTALFKITNQLFDLEFKSRPDIPGFAENVDAFEVYRNHEHVGIIYIDDFQRDTKRGGAWMDLGRHQSDLDYPVTPIVGNALNIAKPKTGEAFLSMEEIITMFHEFGHGLHGLLSKVRYPSQSGTNVPTDFVELPSQLLENWALQPEVLKTFAKNEKGETIPNELLESWHRAQYFDTVFDKSEYLMSAFQDLRLHMLSLDEIENINWDSFESSLNEELGVPDLLRPRYNLTHFNHIFAWDYSASYYAYLWSAVLDADVFSKFKEKDLFDPTLRVELEKQIYSVGHTRPVEESFKAFMGRDPDVQAFLTRDGFVSATPSVNHRGSKP